MNAKKIMGAVLVALLAAALFVGAGAAVPTYFVYEDLGTGMDGAYTDKDGKNTIQIVNGYITGDNIVEGLYGYDEAASDSGFYVMYPDAQISATNNGMSIIGGAVPDNGVVTFAIESYSNGVTPAIVFTSPDGVKTTVLNGYTEVSSSMGSYPLTTTVGSETFTAAPGEWTMQAYFGSEVGTTLKADTPQKYQFGTTVYKFTVVDTDKSISISADSVIKGNTFMVTVSGYPGVGVKLFSEDEDAAGIVAVAGQLGVVKAGANDNLADGYYVNIGEDGKKTVAFTAAEDGKFTIKAQFYNGAYTTGATLTEDGSAKTAKITIIEGAITAEAGADFYYLGTDVKLTGTNTESKNVWFYIKGSNVPFMKLMDGTDHIKEAVKSDKTWEAMIKGDVFKNYDAGTYTIYAVAEEIAPMIDLLSDTTYASVAVALKQPFLTAELSSSVVAQDSKLTISGTAEAAEKVMYYVFGNNKFASGFLPVDDDGTFEKEITIYAKDYATGQYFVVIQHPMYDTVFNIGPLYYNQTSGLYELIYEDQAAVTVGNKGKAEIVLNTTASYDSVKPAAKGNVLFNTLERQSSNAAEALCQALDTQNIDDLYVKATFVVAQPTATINPVDDVAKGAKLVVSGTSNMAPGTIVTVEMLSTAFAAIPKESVNSASFITLTTKVQDDGTWEVEFDTTGLNVDEYTLGATVDDIKTPTVVVKVLESAPVTPGQPDTPVTPEQPEQPEQPTEPETPGFGALAALAGLGAVAVLLLRRE